jgi:MFS transporter, FHS family, glucose/mannose:H+ symporter
MTGKTAQRACAFALMVLGMNAAVLGPSLQTLSKNTGAGLADLGTAFTLLSLGYLVSAPLVALIGRSREHLLLAIPLGLVVAMGTIIAARQLGALLAGAFVLGLSQSITHVGYMALVARNLRAEPDVDGRINSVNAFYGVGALLSPALAALSFAWTGEATAAYAVCIVLCALLLGVSLRVIAAQRQLPQDQAATRPVRLSGSKWPLAIIVVMMGLYVGIEIAISGWATEFTRIVTGASVSQAAIAPTLFFCGLAGSRFFATVVLRRLTPVSFLIVLIVLVAAGLVLMLSGGRSLAVMLFGSLLAGVGCGPIFPLLLSIGIARYPGNEATVSSIISSSGSLGSMTLPAIAGGILASQGTSAAWLLVLTVTGALALVCLALRRVTVSTR